METEFIYWRHRTVPGIKVEEICGADDKPLKLWLEIAYQVYGENGRDGFRELGHYRNGAPFIQGETSRISVTHSGRFLAIATLPPTPEVNLSNFSERAAMGIDAESANREQVLKIRDKFLSEDEQKFIPADDVTENIIAWTAKEALYKSALTEGLDFRNDIKILKLPSIGAAVPVREDIESSQKCIGKATINIKEGDQTIPIAMLLYSYESEGNIVTLAYSPKCAKFGKEKE